MYFCARLGLILESPFSESRQTWAFIVTSSRELLQLAHSFDPPLSSALSPHSLGVRSVPNCHIQSQRLSLQCTRQSDWREVTSPPGHSVTGWRRAGAGPAFGCEPTARLRYQLRSGHAYLRLLRYFAARDISRHTRSRGSPDSGAGCAGGTVSDGILCGVCASAERPI